MKITKMYSREILDSRGNPTVEAEVTIDSSSEGRAIVPSGANTGEKEAVELRDGDLKRYNGKGVSKAVNNVNTTIADHCVKKEFEGLQQLDKILIELDGTDNKSKLGANAILAVSMAFAKAAASYHSVPLYVFLNTAEKYKMPVPCMNVINGWQALR